MIAVRIAVFCAASLVSGLAAKAFPAHGWMCGWLGCCAAFFICHWMKL